MISSISNDMLFVCQESPMDIIFIVDSVGNYQCVVYQESPTDIHGLISQWLEADGLHIHSQFSWQLSMCCLPGKSNGHPRSDQPATGGRWTQSAVWRGGKAALPLASLPAAGGGCTESTCMLKSVVTPSLPLCCAIEHWPSFCMMYNSALATLLFDVQFQHWPPFCTLYLSILGSLLCGVLFNTGFPSVRCPF